MCIRYDRDAEQLLKWSKVTRAWIPLDDWTEGLDTFPGYVAPILRAGQDQGRVIVQAQWGMVPPWASEGSFGRKCAYNARSETLLERPTFREAFRRRRCIVPASAYYERDNGRWVRFRSLEGTLQIAGLYETENSLCTLPSFALVTTDPNERVGEIHDRMPVVLSDSQMEWWLDPRADVLELQRLLTPCPADWTVAEDGGPIGIKLEIVPPSPSLFEEDELG